MRHDSSGSHPLQDQATKHKFIILGIDSHKIYNWHAPYQDKPASDDYYHTLVRIERRHFARSRLRSPTRLPSKDAI